MYRVKPSEIGGDKDNPKSWLYFRYQAWLALNERWDELGNPPKLSPPQLISNAFECCICVA